MRYQSYCFSLSLSLSQDMPVDDDHYLPAAGSGGSNGSPAGLASAGVYEETKFYEWSCKYFANSLMKVSPPSLPLSLSPFLPLPFTHYLPYPIATGRL